MKMRTRIKICGIRTVEQARWAVDAGADAIGLIFCEKSARAVTLEQAFAIYATLPPYVTAVSVFVDPDSALVQAVIQVLPTTLLQFHGQETESFCTAFSKPYIKAVPMQTDTDINAYCERYVSAQGLLLDTANAQGFGGVGQSFDWALIPKKLAKPIILAGGLNIDNVARAIQTVRPFALDLNSGVESSKGVKDQAKIQQCIREVRRVDLSITR